MNGKAAGWYRDPAPVDPAAPSTVRYWDGANWTAQVRSASRKERAAWRHEVAEQRLENPALVTVPQPAYGGFGSRHHSVIVPPSRAATPDGQPLAGWWRRVGAYWIDSVITSLISAAVGWKFIGEVIDELSDAAVAPRSAVADQELVAQIGMPLVWLFLVVLGVKFLYDVGFLLGFQATPGKLALGLEVRLRDRRGTLPLHTVLTRWFTQNVGSFFQLVPSVRFLGGIYQTLDALWPLWDPKKQALHDKVARTNVVRRRL